MPKRTEPGITNRSTLKSGLLAFALVCSVLGPAAWLQACTVKACPTETFSVGTKVHVKAYPEIHWVVSDTWCDKVQLWAPSSTPGWMPYELLAAD